MSPNHSAHHALGPTDTELEIAFALLGRMIARGNDPQLDAEGLIHLGGPVTKRESEWCRANRDAVRAALVGAKRYVPGTLDKIYGLTPEGQMDNKSPQHRKVGGGEIERGG